MKDAPLHPSYKTSRRLLPHEIDELLAGGVACHEVEQRRQQEEREREQRQAGGDRIGCRDPAEDRRRSRRRGGAERVGRADRGAADLGREQLGGVAEPAAEASRDQEVRGQAGPEQAHGIVEMPDHHQQCGRRDGEGRDDVSSSKKIAERAADPIGEDRDEHPDREEGRGGLEAEMLLVGEELRHPCRPADPGEQIEEVDERRDQHVARIVAHRRENIEPLLQALLHHRGGHALVARAFVDADAHPQHQERRQHAQPVERAPAPQRHHQQRNARAQHVAERVAADEAAERGRAPFGRRGLAHHHHADRIFSGERNTCERGEDEERDPAGGETGEPGEDRIAQDCGDQHRLAAVEVGQRREHEDADESDPAPDRGDIAHRRRRDAPFLDQERGDKLHDGLLVDIERPAQDADGEHGRIVAGPAIAAGRACGMIDRRCWRSRCRHGH